MKIFFSSLLFSVLWMMPQALFAASAESVVWPLKQMQTLLRHEDKTIDDAYHIGIDAGYELGGDTPIVSIADGVVRYAQKATGFGYLVMIEHTFDDGKKTIVSQYGHLSPRIRPVRVGDVVAAGDMIGVLGKKNENGGWVPHIHFALFDGKYAASGQWKYYGHVRSLAAMKESVSPSQFFEQYRVQTKKEKKAHVVSIQQKAERAHLQILSRAGSTHRMLFSQPDVYHDAIVDVATADLNQDGKKEILLAFLEDGVLRIDVRSARGLQAVEFIAATDVKNAEIDLLVADVRGTTAQEIMIGLGDPSRVLVFSSKGKQIADFAPFAKKRNTPLSIAAGDMTTKRKKSEIVIFAKIGKPTISIRTAKGKKIDSWRAMKQRRHNGEIAVGEMTGEETDEVVIAAPYRGASAVRVFAADGSEHPEMRYFPFGRRYTRQLDVDVAHWNNDGIADITVSKRAGRSRIRTHNGATQEIFFDTTLYQKKYTDGLLIDVFE